MWLSFGLTTTMKGQVLLQLEIYDNPKSYKYGPGSKLSYKTTTMEDWETEKIESIDYENQIIVFQSGYEHLDNIVTFTVGATATSFENLSLSVFFIG